MPPRPPDARAACLLLAVIVLGSCGSLPGVGYLVRAGWSEAWILLRREPIADVLARPEVGPTLRSRLRLVLDVRRFAANELGLRVGETFETFAEVDDTAIVHVVSAAHRDRLVAFDWWYPLVGRLPYRGFFDRAAAEAAAERLTARGLDVDVRPTIAFSTLGWFADPVLSTMTAAAPVELVDTVIHELLHATLFVPGEAAFNESAATFVGRRGTIAFFCRDGDADACVTARRRWQVTRRRGRLLWRLARRLERLYAARPTSGTRERVRGRIVRAAARSLAEHRLGTEHELEPPNNARLLAALLYTSRLDVFERLEEAAGGLPEAVAVLVQVTRDATDAFAAVNAVPSTPYPERR